MSSFELRSCAMLICSALLTSCVSAPIVLSTPVLVRGIVSHPQYTGWMRDSCGSGSPVRSGDVIATEDCIPHGGEIYAATLSNWSAVDGSQSGRAIRIAFPAHALPKSYRRQHSLVLEPSPADLRAATGLDYIVTE